MMTNDNEREEAKTINEMRDSVLGKLRHTLPAFSNLFYLL